MKDDIKWIRFLVSFGILCLAVHLTVITLFLKDIKAEVVACNDRHTAEVGEP